MSLYNFRTNGPINFDWSKQQQNGNLKKLLQNIRSNHYSITDTEDNTIYPFLL
jgi:hypothetical protein